jgi:hypothetical protein
MSATSLTDLEQAGIISAAQHTRALTHPQYHTLPGNANPAEQITWLVEHDIIDDEDLERARPHIVATQTGEQLACYTAAIDAGLAMFVDDMKELNRPGFDALVDEGLITPEEREAAMASLEQDALLAMSPAALLLWMTIEGIIDNARLAAIGATPPGGSARRAAILTELAGLTEAGKVILVDDTAPRSSCLPWVLAGAFAVCGAIAWLVMRQPDKPAAPPEPARLKMAPACTDKDLYGKLNARLTSNYLLELGAAPPGVTPQRPTLEDIKEIGYERERDVRACVGRLRTGYAEQDYGFTLEPDGKNAYLSTPAHAVLLRARYQQEGPLRGEPVGRDALDAAFRAGLESLRGNGGGFLPRAMRRPDDPQPPGNSVEERRTWERSRTIADIEPLGQCVTVKPGKAYRCKLMIEHHGAIGFAADDGSTHVMQGDFTFERPGPDAPWQTSADFQSQYTAAMFAALRAGGTGN